ncbi:hypothetical protein OESDEN_00076 [Oesophagostomum dentatum]|uniref:Uncharacterized protein n=1 Tax=Oesophagostomum dentatum TaxID=61180 RepID=A0A0B1TUR3_OESDE|nr:hypothetical protein OESDEN_00076 [Oesophagostomum dentatum]
MEGDLAKYCVELERLTQLAYPDASEGELSRTRGGELVSQLIYTTMEIAPKEMAYEMVKTIAQRCERSKEVAKTMKRLSEATKPRFHQQPKRTLRVWNTNESHHKNREKESSLMELEEEKVVKRFRHVPLTELLMKLVEITPRKSKSKALNLHQA